jgi:hypothetical protein
MPLAAPGSPALRELRGSHLPQTSHHAPRNAASGWQTDSGEPSAVSVGSGVRLLPAKTHRPRGNAARTHDRRPRSPLGEVLRAIRPKRAKAGCLGTPCLGTPFGLQFRPGRFAPGGCVSGLRSQPLLACRELLLAHRRQPTQALSTTRTGSATGLSLSPKWTTWPSQRCRMGRAEGYHPRA